MMWWVPSLFLGGEGCYFREFYQLEYVTQC